MSSIKSITDYLVDQKACPEAFDADGIMADLLDDMEKGLAGHASSVAMIPTFITVDRPVPANTPAIVVDAGGTNLRVAKVVFNSEGAGQIDYLEKYRLPGLDGELSRDEFINQIADYILPIADGSDKIGFCFSYPSEISPDRDGKLIKWTKEVKVPGMVGEFVGHHLGQALKARGFEKSITVLNDTIAVLMAGRSAENRTVHSGYVGLVLGTGTNVGYVESNRNITKLAGPDRAGSQAINEESGNFNRCPRGPCDIDLDKSSLDPGQQMLEKMIGGRYIGDLVRNVIKKAGNDGLFSEACASWAASIGTLETEATGDVLKDPQDNRVLPDGASSRDREVVHAICRGITARGARLTAVNVAAAAFKAVGGGECPVPVCITADGSTFYKTPGYKDRVDSELKQLLGSRGIAFELVKVDEAPIIGAAIAGTTH